MSMKKFISVLVAATVVILSCLFTVSAGTLSPATTSGSMEISAERSELIEIAYPADIEIPYGESNFTLGEISASKMIIALDKKVTISVASENDCALVSDGGKIPYTLSGADSIEFTRVNDTSVFPLAVSVTEADWEAATAGEYNDTLTFTLAYVNK